MASDKRVSIGVDEVTNERLAKLEKVTGIPKRDHLRRAVERYFNDAPELFTSAAVDALARMPTTVKERARLDNARSVSTVSKPALRKRPAR